MAIIDFIRRHRNKSRGVAIAVLIPVIFLGALMLVAKSGPDADEMRAAAIALDTFYSDNPPNGVWEYQGVRIVDGNRLVVDVHVAVVPHATVIESRNNRIRFSYMKLACPTGDPLVEKCISQTRVRINLHFHGKTLIGDARPRYTQGDMFSS